MKTDVNKPYLEWCDRGSGSVKQFGELGQTAAQEFIFHYTKQAMPGTHRRAPQDFKWYHRPELSILRHLKHSGRCP